MAAASVSPMQPAATRDLFFKCELCEASLVVDRAAAGMKLACQSCGKDITVPHAENASSFPTQPNEPKAQREKELQRHLRENESQRTEITGYINQLNIQLHRWQLRLQTLNDRNAELKTELARPASQPEPLSH